MAAEVARVSGILKRFQSILSMRQKEREVVDR
jgi:hypothetical protein